MTSFAMSTTTDVLLVLDFAFTTCLIRLRGSTLLSAFERVCSGVYSSTSELLRDGKSRRWWKSQWRKSRWQGGVGNVEQRF